jgi:hypothetical protein
MTDRTRYLRFTLYLVASYLFAAFAMSPFAGNTSEVWAFGTGLWIAPAIIALIRHRRATLSESYKWSAVTLIALTALAWAVILFFQMTY